jgi:hypothetical protein
LLEKGILKEKVFDMPAISAVEAAEKLDFIDHPFYVFRNKVSFILFVIIIDI